MCKPPVVIWETYGMQMLEITLGKSYVNVQAPSNLSRATLMDFEECKWPSGHTLKHKVLLNKVAAFDKPYHKSFNVTFYLPSGEVLGFPPRGRGKAPRRDHAPSCLIPTWCHPLLTLPVTAYLRATEISQLGTHFLWS